jgi:hypothetical protein
MGKFALTLRDDFYRGSSALCETFDNQILSGSEDFEVR